MYEQEHMTTHYDMLLDKITLIRDKRAPKLPALLNKRSEGTLLPHLHKYFRARVASIGSHLASIFHH